MKAAVVIPARYASTRFPGKPLAPIAGRPMIEWVWSRARRCTLADRIIVATEDDRVARLARSLGAETAITRADHATGSDRIAEVALGLEHDIVVNVQGDEPLIDPRAVDAAIRPLMEDPTVRVASLMRRLSPGEETHPNTVKVVTDRSGDALYFSRSAIPFWRDPSPSEAPPVYWGHIGIYAFRRPTLLEFPRLAPTALEQAEKLEQLRLTENGIRIRMAPTDYRSIAVDRPEDVAAVEAALAASPASPDQPRSP